MSGAMHVLAFKLRNSGFDQHICHSTCVSLETRSIYRADGSRGEGPISPGSTHSRLVTQRRGQRSRGLEVRGRRLKQSCVIRISGVWKVLAYSGFEHRMLNASMNKGA